MFLIPVQVIIFWPEAESFVTILIFLGVLYYGWATNIPALCHIHRQCFY